MSLANINQSISSHFQYLRSYKQALASGQGFDYRTGQVGVASSLQQTAQPTVAALTPEQLQTALTQLLPMVQWAPAADASSALTTAWPHQAMFSRLIALEQNLTEKLAHLDAMLQHSEAAWTLPDEDALMSRTGVQQESLLRGNAALDELLTRWTVSSDEQGDNADGDGYHLSTADQAALKDGLRQGVFTPKDLGLALMAKMSRCPAAALDELGLFTETLIAEGVLDPRFLFNPYLKTMDPQRQGQVMQAIANAGPLRLQTADRSGWHGFLLQNVNQDQRPELRDILRDLLRRYYQRATGQWQTPLGAATRELLQLAGSPVTESGEPVTQPPPAFPLTGGLV